MENKLNKLQDNLEIEDIDFRVSEVKAYQKEDDKYLFYAQLLAYKDARVDMKRLDEVCGIDGWQNKYFRDDKGVLQCGVGVWSANMNEWIWKYSNGVPSNFEGEKGEYSDALKRAGFMWGIGRELYDMPRLQVWLNNDEYWTKGTDKYGGPDKIGTTYKFTPNEWHWKIDWEHEGEHGAKGLVWAKESPASNGYRIKPINIYVGKGHTK